jgi:hypothetical protein
MLSLEQLILDILEEENMSGGEASAFGSGVESTATQFSGDNYAKKDARNIFGNVRPGVMTRGGLIKGRKSRRKKRRKKKKH